MSLPIFYTYPDQVRVPNSRVMLSGKDGRHLSRSLRAKVGDLIPVGDGEGTLAVGKILRIGSDGIEALIQSVESVARERPIVTLFQGLCKPSKIDQVVSRAAESGVAEVIPFDSPRSPEGSLEACAKRMDRWGRVAYEASKVAGRAWPLKLDGPVEWPPPVDTFSGYEQCVVFWEEETEIAFQDALPAEAPESIAVVIGPEGGISREDVEELFSLGCRAVTLGDLTIRTETAGSYAAMLIRYHYGLLKRTGH